MKTATRIALLASALTMAGCTTMAGEGVDAAATDSNKDSMTQERIPAPDYPATETVDVVEPQFGVDVADPYRWLEDDVRNNEKVAEWVKEENAVTDAYLAKIPGPKELKKKLTALYDYERYGLPTKAGNYYFYSKNDGLQPQSVLYVREGLNGEPRVLIDPNLWAKDGATALDAWVPSEDGSLIAYMIQDGGSDWRTIKFIETATGKVLKDEIEWVKFSGLSWLGNDGVIYSRFPEPDAADEFQALNLNQHVVFHELGTPQSEDTTQYITPDEPELNHIGSLTSDDQWFVITSSSGTDDRYRVMARPTAGQTNWQPVIPNFENNWSLIDGVGDDLYFITNKDAPRLRVVKAHMTPLQEPVFTEIVPQRDETLEGASIVDGKLILSYLKDAKSLVQIVSLSGEMLGTVGDGEIGTLSGFGGKPSDTETFYAFSSFTRPTTIYRYDMETGKSSVFASPKLSFNPDDFVTEQVFYPSKDGTKIPMFITRSKSLASSGTTAPTLLYGYGGFNISLTPGYSPTRMAWMQSGGVFAQANLRGGGEYGKPWHDGGRLLNKQNVFDDFAAAGEYLKAKGYTGSDQLAIDGRSNGGLLVGASVNQRPDLFDAAHAAVGVMDMLRFDRFTAGRYWVDDYGYPNKEADFRNLLSFSPYHNIKDGVEYPAIIVTTADTDDRVVPGHSFKFAAALQAADAGDKPHLIRIETRAGHGSGKPVDKQIEEAADVFGFLGYWTGLFK